MRIFVAIRFLSALYFSSSKSLCFSTRLRMVKVCVGRGVLLEGPVRTGRAATTRSIVGVSATHGQISSRGTRVVMYEDVCSYEAINPSFIS